MEQILLSRDDLATRWNTSVKSIQRYEEDGIITRVPKLPVPRYNINQILKLEGTELTPLSPIERRRMQNRIEELEKENLHYQEQLNLVRQAIS